MKQEIDWLHEVGHSLRDSELTPPPGGWERLETALPAVTRPRWRIYVARVAAVAAVLLLGVLAGELLWQPEVAIEELPTLTAAWSDESATVEQPAAPVVEAAPAAAPLLARAEIPRKAVAPLRSVDPEMPAIEVTVADNHELTAVPDPQTTAATTPETQAAQTRAAVRQPARTAYPDFEDEPVRKPRRKTSLGAFGSSAVTAGNQISPVTRLMYSDVSNSLEAELQSRPDFGYRESSFRHHQPLSFGLSVRKEFSHGFSLESGLVYTYLSSDVRAPYATEEMSQQLHMLGIPLRANWQFLRRGGFTLYIGAGGMVERCLSAKLGSESVSENDFYWSALAAVGAQYQLGKTVGLYFEPEGAYYFNNTSLRTARTESSLSLSLRLGVRMTF